MNRPPLPPSILRNRHSRTIGPLPTFLRDGLFDILARSDPPPIPTRLTCLRDGSIDIPIYRIAPIQVNWRCLHAAKPISAWLGTSLWNISRSLFDESQTSTFLRDRGRSTSTHDHGRLTFPCARSRSTSIRDRGKVGAFPNHN
jgi:hypothetical protein